MSLLEFQTGLGIFEGLESYSRADVELINLCGDLFRPDADWQLWVQEGLGALLEVAGDPGVLLEWTNQVEPGDTQKLSFQKDEIGIGREPDNDVVVPLAGVGRHHAQIKKQDGRYFLEDLGSANGTYLNEAKLEPHKPVPLHDGAQFLIFPHQFTFSNREVWSRQKPIQVTSGTPRVTTWSESRSREFGGMHLFTVKVAPDIGSAVVRVSQEFLKALVHRISHAEIARLAPADAGLFEFLLLSVLERANHQLEFPFHFSLVPFEAPPNDDTGISIECVIGLTGVTGEIEIFLPASLLRKIRQFRGESQPPAIPVCWPLMATAGYSDLSLQQLAELEVGDILLIASAHGLLLPPTAQGSERGWRFVLLQSDGRHLRIEDHFERSELTMESQAATPGPSDFQKLNLAGLPVRVHIVLSQLEMTFAELNKLRPGSIVELDREKSESVQLAVNGKIAGTGELVEIEGRLGVRISNWNSQ
ncbi:MAG: type III secretion system cytoplasmic ring protein SctQ [Acidobacteriaceae bacterium]|nr:type III secretion system cytoplasmic ring protein SctQ [Acidobacteriaceae bacterium]MBV9498313.1 type III secretion system cytoplasmic ring protein SctQ [Acidobacteriaceae bacterium]